MKRFSNKDIENYYDQTEIHYRIHWKLEEGMGLHYGIWEKDTSSLTEAVLNANRRLMTLGEIRESDSVLDAGCGIGGSGVYLAKNRGCRVQGITLSKKQTITATNLAQSVGVADKLAFTQQDYTNTNFAPNTFDIVWCIESMQTAIDKHPFFKEMARVLKPGGKILIADIFKPQSYDMKHEKAMQTMLNGWAMTDILSLDELTQISKQYGFKVLKTEDVTENVLKSVNMMYAKSIAGAIFAEAYNLFRKTSYFSRIHYKTGIAQKKAYQKKKWGYYLFALQKIA
jgi:tocopherol O-methyltransferase